MRKIKSKNTKPEILLRKALWKKGIRYRLNVEEVIGKPDIVIRKYKIAIFVDGEFWHGYNWSEKKQKIKSNRDYWIPKIERTIERDRKNNEALRKMGWKVFRFWEKEINKELDKCINKVQSYIFNIM
ncbi:very short patch repair endonuclease [Aquimarina sp. SS2-1]|uniref:very short patch repair endonuclease n=1 Tax=Aquimarina besae TaxID=3342247 RepID=UPI00366E2DEE